MTEKIVLTKSGEATAALFGLFDRNVKRVEEVFSVRVGHKGGGGESGDAVSVVGEEADVARAVRALEYLARMTGAGENVSEQTLEYVIGLVRDGLDPATDGAGDDVISVTNRGKPIKARTGGQRKYVAAIRDNTVTLGLGPAGTGKTFLAVAMAVEALRRKAVDKIILTRPAVEAGERLGFLPGDLQSKIDPYLRPLYDALYEMLGAENFARHVERGTIEIAPLAYMRGRTLDNSFIILDEAQNTTPEQMKMFLTRLGNNSKAVVTGDLSQTDLPFGKTSGLSVAAKVLAGIEDVAIFTFSERDVVRHKLVMKIIHAYDKYEKEAGGKRYHTARKDP